MSMRLMGIDYGSKKVGVALTDESGSMAFPHKVFPNEPGLLDTIVELVNEKGVEKIVMGHSIDTKGDDNPIHEQAVTLIGDLSLRLSIPIELEPEHYTSKEAERLQGKNSEIDASAAALILNSYITRKQN